MCLDHTYSSPKPTISSIPTQLWVFKMKQTKSKAKQNKNNQQDQFALPNIRIRGCVAFLWSVVYLLGVGVGLGLGVGVYTGETNSSSSS